MADEVGAGLSIDDPGKACLGTAREIPDRAQEPRRPELLWQPKPAVCGGFASGLSLTECLDPLCYAHAAPSTYRMSLRLVVAGGEDDCLAVEAPKGLAGCG